MTSLAERYFRPKPFEQSDRLYRTCTARNDSSHQEIELPCRNPSGSCAKPVAGQPAIGFEGLTHGSDF